MESDATAGEDRRGAPPVVLVVDDEPDLEQLVRLQFRRLIRAGEIQFHFAHDGLEALTTLEAHSEIDMVVTDINMPNMDGLTLVRELRARHPLVKAIIVSAYADLSNIRDAMNKGAFDFLTKPVDIKDLQRTVQKTVDHVRTIRATFRSFQENRILRMFVDESALDFMLRQGDDADVALGEQVEASIAFVDVCSFTTLCETHPAPVVLSLLNRYFDAIVQEARPHGGVVDKFIGDAAMLTFRGEDHRRRAVRTALAARLAIREMKGEMEQAIGFSPNVSIGINAGQVLAGPVGAQTLGRLDFTMIGDVVNTAARLQGVAGPGEIIVSADFVAPITRELDLTDRGLRSLKGKALPVQLYAINHFRASASVRPPPLV